MIDNFDELVARCAARKRRTMIRFSLKAVATLLLLIAAVSALQLWLTPQTAPTAPALTAETPPAKHPLAAPAADSNLSNAGASVQAPKAATVSAPQKNSEKLPEAVVQQTQKTVSEGTPPEVPAAPTDVRESTPSKTQSAPLFDVTSQSRSAANSAKAYDKDPSYDTALATARYHYEKNEFSDAAVWAKKANQLNREGEEAWLLYAKSYYAQGRKSEAIGVLELYLNYKDSKAASELLRTWKRAPAN